MNERLGLFEELQRRREVFYPFIRPLDRVAVKTHYITVDLKSGTRTVGNGPPVAKPAPIADKPRKAVKRRIDPDDLPPTANRFIAPSLKYTVREILEAVAEAFSLPVYALVSLTRSQKVSLPRFAAALMLREKRLMSYPRIAHALKRMDHGTARYEVMRGKTLRATDLQWAANYRAAEHVLCRP